jgi:NADPH:quinone reductase
MSEMIQAGVASESGPAIRRVQRPTPGDGQVLAQVAAAGMNRADLNASKGAATDAKGVDIVVDMVSGPSLNLCMRAAAVRGRVINVGGLGGVKAEFDFDLHAAKRLDYIGVTFRTRTLAEVWEIVTRMRADLWGHVMAGRLSLPIDHEFPLAEAAAAHQRMATNAHFGKIVLIP